MEDQALHYDNMSAENLVIDIKKIEEKAPGLLMECHWHEQIQFYYFTKGKAIARCNLKQFEVDAGNLVILNSKDLHYMENISTELTFYMIKIDLSFIYSNKIDSIQAQFLTPLSQNLILFENVVRDDQDVLSCVERIIDEYYSKRIGFELAIKGQIYDLIVLLLRGYVRKTYGEEEFQSRREILRRFRKVIDYMEQNFTEKIDLERLSGIAGISAGHFCRLFKQITGMSAIDYINDLRINKAVGLIKSSGQNITEIAMNCGFSDSNYFSRIFKKSQKISPMQMKKLVRK